MTEDDALPAARLARKAWQARIAGDTAAAQPPAHAASVAARARPRRERRIVQIAVDGDTDRASGLIAEHLAEFPGDHLIRRVQAWPSGRRGSMWNSAKPSGT